MPRSSPSNGFTLVELLVSISIIGVITGMMMANFRGGQQSAEVRLATDILVTQIRAVQTSALTGRLVSVCSGGSRDLDVCEPKDPTVICSGGVCQKRVPSGYGIRFTSISPTVYTLFYDTDADRRYDAGEELADAPYVSTAAVRFQTSDAGDPVDLVFTPPFGQIHDRLVHPRTSVRDHDPPCHRLPPLRQNRARLNAAGAAASPSSRRWWRSP
jgi:prepilin-type N-terminal cleavage/methylation domain-containing protein